MSVETVQQIVELWWAGGYTGQVHKVPPDCNEVRLLQGGVEIVVPVHEFVMTNSVTRHEHGVLHAGYHPVYGLFVNTERNQ